MNELQRLEAGIKAAHEAGNEDHVRALGAEYRRLQAEMQEQDTAPDALSEEDQELFGSTTGSTFFGDGGLNEFVIGVGKGVTDVGRGAQDLWHRFTGNPDDNDALTRLTKKAEEEQELYDRHLGDSKAAFAGEMLGEILTTAPVGLGVGSVARGATGVKALLAAGTEGAIAEGITRRGDLGDRASAAAGGFVGGAAGDLLLKGGGKLVRRVRKGRDTLGVREGFEGREAAADALQEQAARDGGFQLDRVDAMEEGFLEREALRLTEDGMSFRKQQEADILAKAKSLVDGDFDAVGDVSAAQRDAAEGVFERLQAARRGSEADVDAAWDAWRDAADSTLDGAPVRRAIKNAYGEMLAADRMKIGKKLQSVMKDYGMDGRGKAQISASDIGQLRIEFNTFAKNAKGTQGRAWRNLKTALEDAAVKQTDGAGKIGAGKTANDATAAHFQKWGDSTFLGRLTKEGIDGEGFARDPVTEFKSYLRPGNLQKLKKLQQAVAETGDAALTRQWDSLRELPLVDALQKSIDPSTGTLSTARLGRELDKLDTATKELLWGPERASEVQKALEAWKLHGRKPSQKGALNNSNTAHIGHNVMSVMARLAAAGGMFGRASQVLLAIPAALSAGRQFGAKTVRELDAQRLAEGKLPKAAEKRLRRYLEQELNAAYGPRATEYGTLVGWLVRNAVREGVTEE